MIKHRTFIFFLASLLASAFIVSPAVAQRGIVPVPIKDVAGNQVGLYKGSYALIIGVSDYTEGWQDLESVPNEVDDLVSTLEEQGFHVVKMLNPNSRKLKEVFEDFIAQYGFDPDNRLLFFFSGHGYTRQVGNITKGYLVPTDAPIPEHDPKGFKNKALSMKQIITWAEGEIESKHALFLFDSCFSGTILTSRSRPPIPRPIRDSTNHPVRQFISSGSAGQLVPSQSVFVPYFIRALKGDGDMNRDGYVTGTELGLYLRDQIMGGDTHQTPQVGKSFNPNFNEGDFVFSLRTARLDVPVVDEVFEELERKKAELKRLEEMRQKSDRQKELDEINRRLEEEKRLAREREKRKLEKLMRPLDNAKTEELENPVDEDMVARAMTIDEVIEDIKKNASNRVEDESFQVRPKGYSVQRGDTLKGIALRLGISVRALKEHNNSLKQNRLLIGEVLQLPTNFKIRDDYADSFGPFVEVTNIEAQLKKSLLLELKKKTPVFEETFRIAVSFANLRDKPNTKDSKILFVLKQGDLVIFLEEKGKWSRIRSKPGSGDKTRTGWVASKLLGSIDTFSKIINKLDSLESKHGIKKLNNIQETLPKFRSKLKILP